MSEFVQEREKRGVIFVCDKGRRRELKKRRENQYWNTG